ncbi:hypothetical protein MASR1M45_01710 [Candidatus Kapaibacterium sp.]
MPLITLLAIIFVKGTIFPLSLSMIVNLVFEIKKVLLKTNISAINKNLLIIIYIYLRFIKFNYTKIQKKTH